MFLRGIYWFRVSVGFCPGWVLCCSFILRFCWFIELIMIDTFLALLGSSSYLLSFTVSWPLMFVIVFLPLLCELFFWVFFVMQDWRTWINLLLLYSLTWKVHISPLRLKDSFAEYMNLWLSVTLSVFEFNFSMLLWLL
jgi:hypothetical protein